MTTVIRIQDIEQYIGKEVTLRGWLYRRTDKGRLQFLQIRDGSGFVQCVVFKKEVSAGVFEATRSLTQESSLTVTGTVRRDPRAPGVPHGYELGVSDLRIVQVSDKFRHFF